MTEVAEVVEGKCSQCGAQGNSALVPSTSENLKESVRRAIAALGVGCDACEQKWRDDENKIRLQNIRCWATRDVHRDNRGALRLCGVPERLLGASFAACPDIPGGIVEACNAWGAEPTGFLMLAGPVGSGKTWLSVAVLRAVLQSGCLPKDALFLSETDFLAGLKANFDSGGDLPYQQLYSRHPHKVKMLVLDDVGSSYLTSWGKGEICKLIERRYTYRLRTVLTSNIGLGDFGRNIDARAASRIGESKQVHTFPAKDLRLHGRYAKDSSLHGKEESTTAEVSPYGVARYGVIGDVA